MQDINEITLVKKGSLNKIKTTITVKMGTKHRLLELARKGESYDDVISRLIHSYDKYENEMIYYRNLLSHYNIEERNIIEVSKLDRGIDAITLSNGAVIQFSYNKPISLPNDLYQMDIQIDKVISGKKIKKMVEEMMKDPYQKIMVHLWMVGRVINRHFDIAFELPSRKMIIDPIYWKKVKDRIGLPESSYKHDILDPIKEYEDNLHE